MSYPCHKYETPNTLHVSVVPKILGRDFETSINMPKLFFNMNHVVLKTKLI
jgi:hypothetical protein